MTYDIAIHVRGLGKKYTIGGPQEKYLTFRDAISSSVKAPFKRILSHEKSPEFWALRSVSFDVEPGEVVGIIGRNGAGKSTLLKILSRITSPTEGIVDLYGRVGSLLEVGTGFHPELTGRENVYLSGSIIGMKKREINEKFDAIVKFAEMEKFLDTPVKRYSSGMYIRLAFAVAAHLDPEILVIDEVLAVGDASFQKKCLGKMGDVAKEGRTVLFVSHNMAAIKNLCPRSIHLYNGEKIADGSSLDVIDEYIRNLDANIQENDLARRKDRKGSGDIIIKNVRFYNEAYNLVNSINSGQKCIIEISYESRSGIPNPNIIFGITIYSHGCPLINLSSGLNGMPFQKLNPVGNVYCFVSSLPLSPGIYSYNVICSLSSGVIDHVIDAGRIIVNEFDFLEMGKLPTTSQSGTVLIRYNWCDETDFKKKQVIW